MIEFDHIRGATFELNFQAEDRGEAMSLQGFEIRSWLRRRGTGALVEKFEVQKTNDTAGRFRLTSPDTSQWPVATLAADVELKIDTGMVYKSYQFLIHVHDSSTGDDE